MDTVSQVAFVLIGLGLFLRGILNTLWSTGKEARRFRQIVELGLKKHLVRNGLYVVVFGGILSFGARGISHSGAWQVAGGLIAILGITSVCVAVFGNIATPTLDQVPNDAIIAKRTVHRRISGIMFLLGGLAWILSGTQYAA